MAQKWDKARVVRTLCCSAIALAGCAFGVLAQNAQTAAAEQATKDAKTISQLTGDLTQVTKDSDEVMDEVDLEAIVAEAAKAGDDVAARQSAYLNMPSEDLSANAEAIRTHFDEASDGGARWYNVDGAVWVFVRPYTTNATAFDVVWLCLDSNSDHILSYSTARYDVDSGVFTSLVHHDTAAGNARIEPTYQDDGAADEAEFQDLVDEISEAASAYDVTDGASDDYSEAYAARDAANEKFIQEQLDAGAETGDAS